METKNELKPGMIRTFIVEIYDSLEPKNNAVIVTGSQRLFERLIDLGMDLKELLSKGHTELNDFEITYMISWANTVDGAVIPPKGKVLWHRGIFGNA